MLKTIFLFFLAFSLHADAQNRINNEIEPCSISTWETNNRAFMLRGTFTKDSKQNEELLVTTKSLRTEWELSEAKKQFGDTNLDDIARRDSLELDIASARFNYCELSVDATSMNSCIAQREFRLATFNKVFYKLEGVCDYL